MANLASDWNGLGVWRLASYILCIAIAHRRAKLTQEEDRKTRWGGIIASSFGVLHRADQLLRLIYNAAFDSTQTLLKLNVLHEISSKSVICGSHDVIDRYLIGVRLNAAPNLVDNTEPRAQKHVVLPHFQLANFSRQQAELCDGALRRT